MLSQAIEEIIDDYITKLSYDKISIVSIGTNLSLSNHCDHEYNLGTNMNAIQFRKLNYLSMYLTVVKIVTGLKLTFI